MVTVVDWWASVGACQPEPCEKVQQAVWASFWSWDITMIMDVGFMAGYLPRRFLIAA